MKLSMLHQPPYESRLLRAFGAPQSPLVFVIRPVGLLTHTSLVARYPWFIASKLALIMAAVQDFHSKSITILAAIFFVKVVADIMIPRVSGPKNLLQASLPQILRPFAPGIVLLGREYDADRRKNTDFEI